VSIKTTNWNSNKLRVNINIPCSIKMMNSTVSTAVP